MKSKFVLLISCAYLMEACAGGNMEKASVESGKADSLVRAKLSQKEVELKRINDSIINLRAVESADSIQKYEKEHGRASTYENMPTQAPNSGPGANAQPVVKPQNGKPTEVSTTHRLQPSVPIATDHPAADAGTGGSTKAKPVKK